MMRCYCKQLPSFPFSYTFLYLINFIVNLWTLGVNGSWWPMTASISSMSSQWDTMNPGLWASLIFVELDSWCFIRGQRPPHRHHHRCVVRYHSILILPQTILHREYGTMWKCYTHRSGRLGKEHQYLLVYNQDTTRGKDYPKKTQLPKAQCGRFNASDREIHERS